MGKRTKVAASPIGEHLEARSSSPTWETLRDWLRGKIRELMQGLLEEEVTEFLGRARYERRAAVDACGYRNGYGKAAQTLGRDWERMVTFYRYPKEHWRHLRTTNVIERPSPRCGCGRMRPSGSRKWNGPRR